jgi:serine/threonine protein kinase
MLEAVAQYKILDRIGAGGMGELYRARDTRLGRTVAVKVISESIAGDPARRERFLADARAAAALSHPNIAALYEVGEDQGRLFLAFEFVPGDSLDRLISGRPLHPRRAVDFATQIADALADAHAEGVVHRDIKPSNIIVTPRERAKVLDFGLSAWTTGGIERQQAARLAATPDARPGGPAGTAAYLSPEQALGEQVDHRTDIFSLGTVLFEMLTGRPPFAGTASSAPAMQIVQATAPPPSSVNRTLPTEVDAVVLKALAKSLDQRHGAAATFAAELRAIGAILDVRSGDEPASVPVLIGPPRRSHRGWIVALIVAGLLAAAWFWGVRT